MAKILVVDDDAAILDLVGNVLNHRGVHSPMLAS